MKNDIYNSKVKVIRDIFDTIMSEGYFETKEDAISIYTKDKFENQIYVRKLDINKEFKSGYSDKLYIESVAITTDDYNFDSCCDADVRVAIHDMNIGKRVICWINELNYHVLSALHDYILSTYETDLDIKYYNKLIESANKDNSGKIISVPRDEFMYIMNKFKNEVLSKK